jgi:hypothetical protein
VPKNAIAIRHATKLGKPPNDESASRKGVSREMRGIFA